jgi:hypothetical protein
VPSRGLAAPPRQVATSTASHRYRASRVAPALGATRDPSHPSGERTTARNGRALRHATSSRRATATSALAARNGVEVVQGSAREKRHAELEREESSSLHRGQNRRVIDVTGPSSSTSALCPASPGGGESGRTKSHTAAMTSPAAPTPSETLANR